jgi:hypothetical protein
MQLMFGVGALWGQRVDVNGNNIGIGPHQFAILQDSSIDFDFEQKDLYSQLGFPLDAARGKGKISAKSKVARIYTALYADLFFGEAFSSGEVNVSQNELITLGAGGLYTVAQSAAFVADLGVFINAGSQLQLQLTTTAPSNVQYGVNASTGVYSFNTSIAGTQLAISYVYTDTGGFEFTIHNNLMGFTPTFQATLYHNNPTLRSTGQMTLRLNTCISSRLTFPTRVGEYTMPDFDFMAIGDGGNRVGVIAFSE